MSQDASNIYAAPRAAYEERDLENTSGMGKMYPTPPEATGWSWGAFLLNWIWAIGNRTWIGLLALVPYLGFIVCIMLGVKGREWAWQNKRWDSIEHFNSVQRRWSIWGVCLLLVPAVIGILAAVSIPAYSDYQARTVSVLAYGHGKMVASHVGAYIVNHRSLPATLSEAGVSQAAPEGVRSVELNPQTAQIEVTMERRPMTGKTFYLAPKADADGYITWTCLRGDIQPSLLPKECRYSAADPFTMPGK